MAQAEAPAPHPIDMNRGGHQWLHPSGFKIWMYVDTPGDYIDFKGKAVVPELAKEAGAPVELHARLKKARAGKAAVEAEMAKALEGVFEETVEEKGGFKLISLGDDMFFVEDEDGDRRPDNPTSEAMARRLFTVATADADEGEEAPAKAAGRSRPTHPPGAAKEVVGANAQT